ncbi:hypothetical protein OFR22_13270 [Brachyspira hyodysenteriae]|nr:hypothetical protein [Brachyspira hyodysenteriae]MCZ9996348.1 hypothetical protein [Brachyspira hyodysenteriae]
MILFKKVDTGRNYYGYFGDDIKKYVFTRNSDIAIFWNCRI